jgi:biotin transport system substrate-specific component
MPSVPQTQTSVQTNASSGAFTNLAALNATLTGKVLLAVCASAFVALCAHIVVPLPFTPVPLTFADFAVLLVGLALGPTTGFAALALYLAEGACGLPVFSPLGPGGVAQLFGHTGGYLIAYPFSAAVAGAVSRSLSRLAPRFWAALTACTLASALLMLTGAIWFGILGHLTAFSAFALGAAPFLPGQVVKVVAATGIYASFRRSHRAN